jgi:hypothetical protein
VEKLNSRNGKSLGMASAMSRFQHVNNQSPAMNFVTERDPDWPALGIKFGSGSYVLNRLTGQPI